MIDICVCDVENNFYENGLLTDGGTVKFLEHRCVVVEYYQNKHYLYYAVNIDTLNTKYLCMRKYPINKSDYEVFAQKLAGLAIEQNNLTLKPTRYEREKQLFSHIFSYILPREGFLLRENQLDLALEILDGLKTNCVSLMEAEVGTGKTHAYIMAVMIHNIFNNITNTTIISTSTIALQKAIIEEYIPQISRILNKYKILKKPISFVVRKGKSHYACDLKLKTHMVAVKRNKSPKDTKMINELERILNANDMHIDLDAYHLTPYVKDRICVTSKCNNTCQRYDNCRFISFNKKCLESHYTFKLPITIMCLLMQLAKGLCCRNTKHLYLTRLISYMM